MYRSVVHVVYLLVRWCKIHMWSNTLVWGCYCITITVYMNHDQSVLRLNVWTGMGNGHSVLYSIAWMIWRYRDMGCRASCDTHSMHIALRKQESRGGFCECVVRAYECLCCVCGYVTDAHALSRTDVAVIDLGIVNMWFRAFFCLFVAVVPIHTALYTHIYIVAYKMYIILYLCTVYVCVCAALIYKTHRYVVSGEHAHGSLHVDVFLLHILRTYLLHTRARLCVCLRVDMAHAWVYVALQWGSDLRKLWCASFWLDLNSGQRYL